MLQLHSHRHLHAVKARRAFAAVGSWEKHRCSGKNLRGASPIFYFQNMPSIGKMARSQIQAILRVLPELWSSAVGASPAAAMQVSRRDPGI